METKKKCLYATLDVAKSASQDQIKTAYKKLALVMTFLLLNVFRNGIQTSIKKKTESRQLNSLRSLVKPIRFSAIKRESSIMISMELSMGLMMLKRLKASWMKFLRCFSAQEVNQTLLKISTTLSKSWKVIMTRNHERCLENLEEATDLKGVELVYKQESSNPNK